MSNSNIATLSAKGNKLETRFKASNDDTRSAEFKVVLIELRVWLTDCVNHGRYLPPGSPERRSLQGQVDYWTSRLRQSGHAFDEIDRIDSFDPKAGRVLSDDLFPYHGLIAATGNNRKIFSGRDEQIKEYADHIDAHTALLIQSESGGGKSSIAMAGVLPELQRRHPEWLIVPRVTPGMRPAEALLSALQARLDIAGEVTIASIVSATSGRTILVYIDQLEELLTMCSDVIQQRDFCNFLSELSGMVSETRSSMLRLIATMRVDHYERLANSEYCRPLYQLLTRENSVKTLPPMSLAQIRNVILKPAESIGLRFVPVSIVERLASESANVPSGLPLLQFALQRLWDERPRQDDLPEGPRLDMITEESFSRLPTVSAALGGVAEDYISELEPKGLVDACRRLMLELTVIDERLEVPLRRRRLEVGVLQTLVGAGLATYGQAQEMVDGLVARRLLVRTGAGNDQQIEVAHEALFRHWMRFQEWIYDEETRAILHEIRRVTHDALKWEQSQRSADLLNLRGAPLQRASALRRALWLEPEAVEYVEACEHATQVADQLAAQSAASLQAERTRSAEAEEKRKRAESNAKRYRERRNFAFGICFAVIAGGGISGYFLLQSNNSKQAAAEAAIMGVTSILPRLPPKDALDLAYTIHSQFSTPESLSTMMHVVDSIGEAMKVGEREHGPAFFTSSGLATVQLVPGAKGLDHALVRLLGPALENLGPEVTIDLGLQNGEDLASIDVGPTTPTGSRLAVVTLVGPEISKSRSMSRARIFSIDGKSSTAQALKEISFPELVRNTSDITFNSTGTRLAMSARHIMGHDSGTEIKTQIIEWQNNMEPTVKVLASEGASAATAVAYMAGNGNELIKGLADGRIDCGTNGITKNPEKWPEVVQLKNWGSSGYAALHKDNSISIGDCANLSEWQARKPLPSIPQFFWVRSIASDAGATRPSNNILELGYTRNRELVCRRYASIKEQKKYTEEEPCPGDGLSADYAMPLFNAGNKLGGYRILDRELPLMSLWRSIPATEGVSNGANSAPPAFSLDTEKEKSASEKDIKIAASPNGVHRLTISRSEDKKLLISRADAGRATERPLSVSNPKWGAVNDQGTAIVLTSRESDPRHQLVVFGADDKNKSAVSTFADTACMKPSPDGNEILVVSDRGEAKRWAVNMPKLQEVSPFAGPDRDGFEKITACAVSNGPNGKAVVATDSGKVKIYDTKKAHWDPISELVLFAMNSPALDVSIDADARFVAVISVLHNPPQCRNGGRNHLVRIWDIKKLSHSEYPVASICLDRKFISIGPIEKSNGTWNLPLYYESSGKDGDNTASTHQMQFICRVCNYTSTDKKKIANEIEKMGNDLGIKNIKPDALKEKYGLILNRGSN